LAGWKKSLRTSTVKSVAVAGAPRQSRGQSRKTARAMGRGQRQRRGWERGVVIGGTAPVELSFAFCGFFQVFSVLRALPRGALSMSETRRGATSPLAE
jgi:hypothetical protein